MITLTEWMNKRRELDEKATKGEWTYSVKSGTQTPATLYVLDEYGDEIDVACFEEWDGTPEEQIANADFIADARLSLPQARRIIEALMEAAHASDCFGLLDGEAKMIAERIINEERSGT